MLTLRRLWERFTGREARELEAMAMQWRGLYHKSHDHVERLLAVAERDQGENDAFMLFAESLDTLTAGLAESNLPRLVSIQCDEEFHRALQVHLYRRNKMLTQNPGLDPDYGYHEIMLMGVKVEIDQYRTGSIVLTPELS